MAGSNFVYLYPNSVEEARRMDAEYAKAGRTSDEVKLWRESFRENIRCKEAIERAISRDFDGMHLKEGCARSVVQEFGFKRVQFVLSNTLQEKDWDGRFSRDNLQWAKATFVPPDKAHNAQFCVGSHPAVLDGFVRFFRREVQALGLFEPKHCVPNSSELDYQGKVLVMKSEVLAEQYWKPEYQLWYAHDGFGCGPHAIGRSIRCTCLTDGEMTRWNRSDFIGAIQEEILPDWAQKKLQELQSAEHSRMMQPGQMEMR